jgi:hypothetical protein
MAGARCDIRATNSHDRFKSDYTIFYFPQSYFPRPTAILAGFLDFPVAIAQIVL